MNRFDRIISILILLQSKNILTAQTVSDRYEVSVRTIYRDIRTLRNAGVPIIGDPGIGYSIVDGYSIPPTMFSEGELLSLITAEKFIGRITDSETKSQYFNAMDKIKATLRSTEKQSLSILDDSIAVNEGSRLDDNPFLQSMFRAITTKKVLSIQYQKPDQSTTERDVESIGCYNQFGKWYLIGYCRLKSDYRTFKMSRIKGLKILEEQFNTKHIGLQEYINSQEESWKQQQNFHTIEIAFKYSFLEHAERRKYYFGYIDEVRNDDTVNMRFLNSSIEIFARWLLQFGDQAEVIAPVELRERLKVISVQLYKLYN